MTTSDRVHLAIWYARQGFGVFPVWSPKEDGSCHCPAGGTCRQPGKHPIPPNGFHAATADETTIRDFLAAGSKPNIGIVPPPGVFGWDVDGKVPETLAALAVRLGPLPSTLTTATGNGTHLFFRWPAGLDRPTGRPFGIVTRWADTGYLIGAGSRHVSGAVYRLEEDEDGEPRPIVELPKPWAEALHADRGAPLSPGQPGAMISEGQRHDFLRDSARMFRGRGLTGDTLFAAIWVLNLERCTPPKAADDVRRAIGEVEARFGADAVGRGEEHAPLPPPSEPMRVANQLVDDRFRGPSDGLVLRHWRTEFWRWRRSHWLEVADAALRAESYRYTEHAVFLKTKKDALTLEPWAPNRYKVADLLDALRAVTHLPETIDMPVWLDDGDHLPATELVACANGLLHIPTRTLVPHDHAFFNRVAVPFDYDADPPRPTRWHAFLDELWHDDPEAISALAEFMGYVISGRRDLHKILLLIGPTRAGKGVIARVLKALVGRGNYAGPTLASLGTNFGLSPLIGKPLAIVSDARLGGANVHQVVERLLSISGEDMLTVDVKYREPWTGTLPTRFLVISNELPRFGDASGAIANRFLVLTMRESFLGREDAALTDELLTELPGILGWVLDGLERLNARGRFAEPLSSRDAIVALGDLVSPTSAFVRDRCEVGPESEVPCDELYAAWKSWAEDNGHRVGSSSSFGRDLRAVLPGLRTARPREDDRRRRYRGLRLSAQHNGPIDGPSWTRPSLGPAAPRSGRGAVQDGPGGQPSLPVRDARLDAPSGVGANRPSEPQAPTPGDARPPARPTHPDFASADDVPPEPTGLFDQLPEPPVAKTVARPGPADMDARLAAPIHEADGPSSDDWGTV